MIFHSSIRHTSQKILLSTGIILILFVGVGQFLFSSSHFLPNQTISTIGFYLSILGGYGIIGIGYYLRLQGKWAVSTEFSKKLSKPFQHLFYFIVIAPLIAVLIYQTLCHVIPSIYTHYWGELKYMTIQATAFQNTNPKAACTYELKNQQFSSLFFDYCLTTQQYTQFNQQPATVQLSIKQSPLGLSIQTIERIYPDHSATP